MVVDATSGAASALSVGMGPRALVVDDEEAVLLTIRGILELDGFEVAATSSGQQALNLLRAQPFDVLLADLRLEDLEGIELLRQAREHAPDTVSIILTGYGSLDSAVEALRQGAYDYLLKPCDVLELRTTVSRGLERSRLTGQLRHHVRELEHANETNRALNLELEARVEAATAELRAQIAARDEFVATVSHDLKSPLTFIKGLASLRRRRAVATPQTAPLITALEQIEASAGRMARQLDELVDTSRLEAGRPLELRLNPTDLVALARQVVAEHQQNTDRHVLRVVSQAPELIGTWDEPRLVRVLDNLLGNAVKYSPRGGAINVDVASEGEPPAKAVVRISDEGEGIPESDLPHIFEQFRRGQNVEGRIPGTGVGLAGVRRILEQHGGDIAVDSRVGQGTTVTVRLPLGSPRG